MNIFYNLQQFKIQRKQKLLKILKLCCEMQYYVYEIHKIGVELNNLFFKLKTQFINSSLLL